MYNEPSRRLLDRWQLAVVLGCLYIYFFHFKKSTHVPTLLLEINQYTTYKITHRFFLSKQTDATSAQILSQFIKHKREPIFIYRFHKP